MNNKQEQVLQEVIKYYQDNKTMPTIRYLQKKLNYRSTRSVYEYLKQLEKNNYLVRNKDNKLIINDTSIYYQNGLKNIKVINSSDNLSLILKKEEEYLGFILKHNFFKKDYLIKGDTLIIEKSQKIKNGDYGLFIINNQYRIMKYYYQDGFYRLNDYEEMILNKINIIGKVIMVERKIKIDR